MTRTLLDLSKSLEKRALSFEAKFTANLNKIALQVLDDLIKVTPVDTSRALSNWRIGIGEPPSGFIEAYFEGSEGSTQMSSAKQAYEIGRFDVSLRKFGEPIYISNTAPYIVDLDRGNSTQFAGGFAERAKKLVHDLMSATKEAP